ncbi:NAD(P)-binding protein [Aaosphaeria arxii CBS 175.79]|uniref:Short-chain dehydrogenase/reductase 3 n=1 Tax=Aaosphaeria arxii CBS 175.79 TaxID=1450172 RepID=A0A6A5XV78_9PLEO|nr:NAD(P)-binding protein [Aaosphaeria arxii CBS 175.79]KAF2016621.1 NAD(P)-binding protein [Aaosphaeria arxii CBS 175.79]
MPAMSSLISLTINHIALNPIVTAPILWILTKGPPELRARITLLQNPQTLAVAVKVLKSFLAIGVLGTINRQLNRLALNSWRLTSQKGRWKLDEEVAVVTGGSSGIGYFIVRGLVAKGVVVAILDIIPPPNELGNNPKVHFYTCDIAEASWISSVVEQIHTDIGSPSILINNAGIATSGSILSTDDEWLHHIYAVNVISNFTTVRAFLPSMIAKQKGHIVTVASTASFLGLGGFVDYTSTKAAVLAFHEGLNQELTHYHRAPNILTTSVHPNWTRTSLLESFPSALRGQHLLEPSTVADAIVRQIERAEGAQIVMPAVAGVMGLVRGLPNWVQEVVRGGTSRAVLRTVRK